MAFVLRAVFVLVSAVTAATAIDPLLEALSNAGFFGAGVFTDHSNADVEPALLAAGLLAALFVVLSVRRRWLRRSLFHLDRRVVYRLLPFVCAMQLGVLFAMETAEQFIVYSHVLGGSLWLGAPMLVALVAHGLGGIVVALILSWALQHVAARVAHVVRRVLGAFAPRRPQLPARCRRPVAASFVRVLEPLLRRVAGRAPPVPSFA